MTRRIERLNEQVRREVSEIIRNEIRDPRVGIVTVTEARVAPDLSIARVYVRPMGDDAEQEVAIEGLEAASPFIRRELAKRMKTRTVPQIRFEADKALDYGMRMDKLLSEIKNNDQENE
jgi:ribosome-binding factor A